MAIHAKATAPRFAVPGVGVLRPCFDRVVFVSTKPVAALLVLLPVATLKQVSHSFDVIRYQGRDPRLQSRLILVCGYSLEPLLILASYNNCLGRYRITSAELAADVGPGPIEAARERRFALLA